MLVKNGIKTISMFKLKNTYSLFKVNEYISLAIV